MEKKTKSTAMTPRLGLSLSHCTLLCHNLDTAEKLFEVTHDDAIRAVNEHDALKDLAYCVRRVDQLNKENFPHRSPEWVYSHPDSPMRIAMNNLLNALNLVERVRKEGGK